jgi:hypothetical protein
VCFIFDCRSRGTVFLQVSIPLRYVYSMLKQNGMALNQTRL